MNNKADLQYHTLDLYGIHMFQTSHSFVMKFLAGMRGAEGANSYYKTDFLLIPFRASGSNHCSNTVNPDTHIENNEVTATATLTTFRGTISLF